MNRYISPPPPPRVRIFTILGKKICFLLVKNFLSSLSPLLSTMLRACSFNSIFIHKKNFNWNIMTIHLISNFKRMRIITFVSRNIKKWLVSNLIYKQRIFIAHSAFKLLKNHFINVNFLSACRLSIILHWMILQFFKNSLKRGFSLNKIANTDRWTVRFINKILKHSFTNS